jgi:phosphoribosylanthranilate isomerase
MAGFPKLKICGVRDGAFARRAEELGVNYLGFIFAEKSPRYVTPDAAAAIAAALTGRAKRVGVFTTSTIKEILAISRTVPLDVVQLHSLDYGADEIQRLKAAGLEVWQLGAKEGAAKVSDSVNPREGAVAPDAVLLDGWAGALCGGTGRRADWEFASELASAGVRVVLAGGLSSANIGAAAATGCAVLDVNSSIEESPGVKSIVLLEELFQCWQQIREPHRE